MLTTDVRHPSRGDELVYVHIGTGHTPSRHYCLVCDGYYGVPHDVIDHHVNEFRRYGCACRPCQERSGTFPREGTFVPRWIMESLVEAEL